MSNSVVKLRLSDSVVENFYSIFGGEANLSVTVNDLLILLLDEAEINDNVNVEDLMQSIRERLA